MIQVVNVAACYTGWRSLFRASDQAAKLAKMNEN
jgi:hypothetical protein